MEEEKEYPQILDRVKAAFADGVVMIIFFFILTSLFESIDQVPDWSRISAFVFIFGLYDPIFTSSFGGTIGHMMFSIRVKREKDETKNIIFPLAIIRFLFKGMLGWISLLTVSSSKKRKAIHDSIVGSVVIYKD